MKPPRALLAFAAFSVALVTVRAVAPNANCDLLYQGTPVSDSSWFAYYNASAFVGPLKDDTQPGTVYMELTTKEVAAFTFSQESPYINVELNTEPSTLRLVVLEAFTRYEEDAISATDAGMIDVLVTFSCSDGNSAAFEFRITVEDVNDHRPEFSLTSYEVTLPMPFPPDTDLSAFVGEITVTDIDFSNNAINITFDELGEQLLNAVAAYQGNLVYSVTLYSKAVIDLQDSTAFEMTAVDSGTPALASDPVSVVITRYTPNKCSRL